MHRNPEQNAPAGPLAATQTMFAVLRTPLRVPPLLTTWRSRGGNGGIWKGDDAAAEYWQQEAELALSA